MHRKYILLILMVACIQNGFGQFFLVQDTDACVNVRGKKNEIIDTIPAGTVVVGEMPYDWPEAPNYESVIYLKNERVYFGNIHVSRLKEIKSFAEIPKTKESAGILSFKKDSVGITVKIKPCDENELYGTHYEQVEFEIGKARFTLPPSSCNDMIYLNPKSTCAYYDANSHTFYLMASGGDGAEGYVIMWVMKKGKYMDRYINCTIPGDVPFTQQGISKKDLYRYLNGGTEYD